jgi:sigma-B regulation protein RsbU (phosphoserine phosphatase)
MKILIAEDEPVERRLLEGLLPGWGFEVISVGDGTEALRQLLADTSIKLGLIDWLMPGLSGVEVCRRARVERPHDQPLHLLLLTIKKGTSNIVEGLEAGADDYVTKPFSHDELKARLKVGERLITLQSDLADRVKELEATLAQLHTIEGLLPICMYCKKIRDDQDYWHQIEKYIAAHSKTRFTHSICPACYERIVADYR